MIVAMNIISKSANELLFSKFFEHPLTVFTFGANSTVVSFLSRCAICRSYWPAFVHRYANDLIRKRMFAAKSMNQYIYRFENYI